MYKLDTKAIFNRICKQAVVNWDGHMLHIAVPTNNRQLPFLSLVDGSIGRLAEGENRWFIRPGDEAEFSYDGEDWHRGIYDRFNIGNPCDDYFFHRKGEGCFRYIRPIRPIPKADPELVKAREEVAEARRKLEQAEATLSNYAR